MLTIIHGEDTAASRNYFYQEKNTYTDSIILDGLTVHIEDIAQNLSSTGLFTEEKHIFIEDLISKRKASNETREIIDYINKHHESSHIYLWESKDLTTGQLKQWNNGTMKQFKLPQSIFLFLDNIKPKNGQAMIQLFHKTLLYKDEQFIFFMLIRHIRLLLALFDPGDTPIEEIKKMSPWQKSKLQKQTKLFNQSVLETIYSKLFTIDLASKSGRLACPLSQTIDFLLLEI